MSELSIRVRVQRGKAAVFTRGGGMCVFLDRPARFKVPPEGGLLVFPDPTSDECLYVSARALLDGLTEQLAEQRQRDRLQAAPAPEERSHA